MATESKSKKRPPRRRCYPAEFKAKAVELKRKHPEHGSRLNRISIEGGK